MWVHTIARVDHTAEPQIETTPAGSPRAGVECLFDGRPRMLDPRWVTVERLSGWITAGVLIPAGLAGVVVVAVGGSMFWKIAALAGWVVLSGVLCWAAHVYPALRYRHARYSVDDEGIEITLGWLWRRVTNVPRSRVQHTDVNQGPIMRKYGIATLVIHTAGTEYAKVELPGLDRDTAMRLRDHLLQGTGDGAV